MQPNFKLSIVMSPVQTVLVISDGVPDNKEAVEKVIIDATQKHMSSDSELSITFIQVSYIS